MTKKQLEEMVKCIIAEADYDLFKELDKDTAEEPHEAPLFLARLVAVARHHVKKVSK